jgi:PAS domain S-box-containing protein
LHSEAEVLTKIKKLLEEKPKGMTTEDLAKALPLNRTSTAKYLNTLLISGQIEQQSVGRAKLFKCSNRLPMAQMLSFSSDSVIVMDSERTVLEINPRFIETFGILTQEVVGKKFDTLSSKVDITYLLLPGICRAVDGQSVTKNHQIKCGDETFHFRSKYLSLVMDNGLPGVAVVLENVTETHQILEKYEQIKKEHTIEQTLRAAAEEQLAHFPKTSHNLEGLAPEKLIYELQVNEIELKMQGEELRESNSALIESRDKYIDLYDFAPLGYLTLNDKAQVTEANLTVATLLGIERSNLIRARFSKFIAEEYSDQWHRYFVFVLQNGEKQACTLMLKRGDGATFPARLESIQITHGSEGTPTVRVIISDITDIRTVEGALAESEQKFRNILNDITDVVWSLSWPDMGVHYLSPSVEQLYGRPVQEFIDKPSLWAEITHPDDKHITDKALEQLRKVGSAVRECRIVRPDGSIAWIHDKSHLIFDERGTPIRVDGISSDITGRMTGAKAIKESEQNFHDIFNAVNEGMLITDLETQRFVMANPIIQKMTGYTNAELLTLTISDIHPQKDLPHVREQLGKMVSGENLQLLDYPVLCKDGTVVYCDINAASYIHQDRKYLIGIFHDTTERKRTELALVESEVRYRAIYDQSPIAIELYDAVGTLVHVNPACLNLFGIENKQEIQNFSLFVDPNINDEQKERLRHGETIIYQGPFDFGKVRTLDLYPTSREGIIWLDVLITPLWNSSDSITGYLVQVQDITERKVAEEALQKSEARYRTLAESSPDNIFIITRDDTVQFVNSRAAGSLNHPADEIIGKPRKNFFPPDIADEHGIILQEVFETGIPFRGEDKIRYGNKEIWQDNALVPIRDEIGDITAVLGVSRDITQSKQAQVALRYEDEMRQTILNSIPVMVMFFDREGHIQFINHCLQSTLGWSHEEMLQHKDIFTEFYPDPEYRENVLEHIRKASGTGLWCDFKTRTHDGHVLDTSWINVPLSDGSVIGIGIDITQRKVAEEELHLKDTAIVSSISAIATSDLSGNLTYINPAFLSIFGYEDPQEVLGRSIISFSNVPDEVQQIISKIQEDGTWSGELVGQRKDGTPFPALITANLIRDASGAPVAMMGSFIDITRRKQMENALHEGEQQYRALFDTITEGVVLIAPDGSIVSANPATEHIIGLSVPEMIGRNYSSPDWKILRPDGTLMPQEELAASRAMKEKCAVMNVVGGQPRPNGSVTWVNVNSVPLLDNTGALKGIVSTLQDITERRQAEEELLQANQQISLLTDITRNDILSRVTSIMGNLSLASKKFKDPEITALFEIIGKNTRDIKSQIEFTRVYQTLGTQEPRWLDLDHLVSQLHVPSHITLKSSLLGIEIYADPLFKQVFFNLLDNAQRHGGHITTITISFEHTRLGMIIICEDDGVGIPLDQKKEIFKRGFGKSTGLGLFLTQEILGITGMKIKETGIEGSGARFEITVPKGAYRGSQQK